MCMQIFKYFTLKVFKHREKLRNFTVNTHIPRTTFYINIYYILFIIYPSIIYNSASFYLFWYFIVRILVVLSHHFNYLPSLLNTLSCSPFSLSYFTFYLILILNILYLLPLKWFTHPFMISCSSLMLEFYSLELLALFYAHKNDSQRLWIDHGID